MAPNSPLQAHVGYCLCTLSPGGSDGCHSHVAEDMPAALELEFFHSGASGSERHAVPSCPCRPGMDCVVVFHKSPEGCSRGLDT